MAHDTESALKDWRYGQTQAERMCADVLGLAGYVDIDPQCPLGGPDGKKDIFAVKSGVLHVAGCFFPTTPQDEKDVSDKFESDAAGARKHQRPGFTFLVNQHLTPGQRTALDEVARRLGYTHVEIFHLERLRTLLDSPKGIGLRAKYLRLTLTPEEQVAFYAGFQESVREREAPREEEIRHLSTPVKDAAATVDVEKLGKQLAPHACTAVAASGKDIRKWSLSMPPTPTTRIVSCPSPTLLCDVHRWLIPDGARIGDFRKLRVVIADNSTDPPSVVYEPPDAESVPGLVGGLAAWWMETAPGLPTAHRDNALQDIATFHHGLLSIHPFTDGNGRVASYFLELHLWEVFGSQPTGATLGGAKYVDALAAAHAGNLAPLVEIIAERVKSA